MNFNNIRNVGYPQHNEDAVPRRFVDNMADSIKESTDKKILDTLPALGKMLAGGLKKRTHIISASASYYGDLKKKVIINLLGVGKVYIHINIICLMVFWFLQVVILKNL